MDTPTPSTLEHPPTLPGRIMALDLGGKRIGIVTFLKPETRHTPQVGRLICVCGVHGDHAQAGTRGGNAQAF